MAAYILYLLPLISVSLETENPFAKITVGNNIFQRKNRCKTGIREITPTLTINSEDA